MMNCLKLSTKFFSYARTNLNHPKVKKAYRAGRRYVLMMCKTPQHKYPAMYLHMFTAGVNSMCYLLIDSPEGTCYAFECHDNSIAILKAHAIKQYIKRSGDQHDFEYITHEILDHFCVVEFSNDSSTYYSAYKDGTFLCRYQNKILTINTWISNSMCFQNERLLALISKNRTQSFHRELGFRL